MYDIMYVLVSEMGEKPDHNKYDNIWEIRQSRSPELWMDDFKRALEKPIDEGRVEKIGLARIYDLVENFVRTIARAKQINLPVFKVITGRLEGGTGAIYYVAKVDGTNCIFRGTYGYGGTGPHESAFVEFVLEKKGIVGQLIEVRGGDYLLNFLRGC